jgi:hypothetical protein
MAAADTQPWHNPEASRTSTDINRTLADTFGNNPAFHDTAVGRMAQEVYGGKPGDYSNFANVWNNTVAGPFQERDGSFHFSQPYQTFTSDISTARTAQWDQPNPGKAAASVPEATTVEKQKAYDAASNVLANNHTSASQKLQVLEQLAVLGENNITVRDRDKNRSTHQYRIERNEIGDGRAQVRLYHQGEDGQESRILSGVSDGNGHFEPERGRDGRLMSWRGPNSHSLLKHSGFAEHDAPEQGSERDTPRKIAERHHGRNGHSDRRHRHNRGGHHTSERAVDGREDAESNSETEQVPPSKRVQIAPSGDTDQPVERGPNRSATGNPESTHMLSELFGNMTEDRSAVRRRLSTAPTGDAGGDQAYARALQLAKSRGADQPGDQDYANVPYYKTHLRPDERFPDQIENPEKFMNAFLHHTKQRAQALGTVGQCGQGVREGASNTDPQNIHLIGDPKNVGFFRTATELGQLFQNLGWTKITLKDLSSEQRETLPTSVIVRPWSFNPNGAGDIAVKEHRGKQYNDHTQGFDYGSSRYAGTYALLPPNHPYAIAHRQDSDTRVATDKNS